MAQLFDCISCDQRLPRAGFHSSTAWADGRSHYCIDCKFKQNKAENAERKEKRALKHAAVYLTGAPPSKKVAPFSNVPPL